jgi:tripartite-type tricarboxylate transporter receptor subunit TctC
MKKLRYLTYLVILLVFVLSTTAVLEAANVDEELDWPKRTITIVVPFGTGGDSDFNARVMAKYLSKELGVNVVVENISGSGGSIGSSAVKDAEPDGYTVLQNHNALMISRANGISDFGLEAFELVGITAANPGDVFAVASSTGIETLDDLVEACKKQKMTVATNIGATTQVLSFMLAEYADVVQVDVGGIADKVVALLGGHVDIIVGPYGNVKPYVDSGDFNILGVCGKERAALYPEVPTCIEQGYEIYFPTRFFMAFPRGTDQRIVEKFRAAVEKIITTNEEYAEEIAKAYYQSPLFLQPEEALEVYAEIDELIGRYKLTELK